MIFNGKTIKSVANKFLGKPQKPGDETVEIKADAWKSMYTLFCNQTLSTPGVAIESLKTLNALADCGIVGDYRDLQKVLLHKNDEAAHLALDVLRKIKGLALETRIEAVEEAASPDSGKKNAGEAAQEKSQQIKTSGQIMPDEKEIQNRILDVLNIEEIIAEKLRDVEKKIGEQDKKISEMPASLAQEYNSKARVLEENMKEIRKLMDSKNIMAEKTLAEKLSGIEKRAEELDAKISEMPASLAQDYNSKTRVLEENMKELQKSMDSKNVQAEKILTEKLEDIENKAEELDAKISEMPASLSQDYNSKTRILEENMKELQKSMDSKNIMAEKTLAEKLSDIEKKIEGLGAKISEMPANLTQDYANRTGALEENIKQLKKSLESKNVQAEKIIGQALAGISPTGHMPGAAIPRISQSMRKASEENRYGSEGKIRLPFLDTTPETFIILVNWIKFLMEKVGRNNLADILDYYVEIGWISEEVSSAMARYAEGLDYYIERPKSDILPEVHTKSLLFIEMLTARISNKKRSKFLQNLTMQ